MSGIERRSEIPTHQSGSRVAEDARPRHTLLLIKLLIKNMLPYNTKIKEKAIALRKKGKSFSQIAKTLGLGKSTVGFWFKNVIPKTKVNKPVQKKAVKTKSKKTVKKKNK